MTSRGQLSRFTLIFASGTMLSRVLGLVRNTVIAALIPDASRDAFIFAFRLPNMLRDMLGEGAANAAFIPVMSETQEREGPEAYRELIASALGAMLLIFSVLTALGLLLIPFLPDILALFQPIVNAEPKTEAMLAETVAMMMWIFPYLLMIGLAVYAMAPLFTSGHYSTPSWSPVLLNIALIASCIALYRYFDEPAWSLVVGVWIGGLAQLFVMFRAMWKHTGVLRPRFNFAHPGVKKSFLLLTPVILGQSAAEINKLVDNFFAYSLPEGTVSALFYANQLVQLPLAVFGIAVSVAILPAISRAGARGDADEIRRMLVYGFRGTFFLTIPSALGLIALGEPIIRLLFGWGHFGEETVQLTALALKYYGVGLLFFSGIKVCVQGFYAVQNTKLPVTIAALSMLLNIALSFALVGPLGMRGLVLAGLIATGVNFTILFAMLTRRYGWLLTGDFLAAFLKMCFAAVAMAVPTWYLANTLQARLGTERFWAEAVTVALPMALAIALYGGLCWAMRLPEMNDFARALRRRA